MRRIATRNRLSAAAGPVLLVLAAGFASAPPAVADAGPPTLAVTGPEDAHVPRNIILMVADGGGFNHFLAGALWRDGARLFAGWEQLETRLAVATFAEGGAYDSREYWSHGPEGQPATDSAAAITALTTGRRTLNGRLAVGPDGSPLRTIVAAMEQGGRSTGLVTSVQFAHATPAGCAVNGEDRNEYLEISRELVTRSPVDVLMGAGHPLHDRQGGPAGTPDFRCVGGPDTWEGLLAGTAGGDADGDGWPDPWLLLQDAADIDALAEGPAPRRILGLARVRETLQQQRPGDRQAAPFAEPPLPGVPTLAAMARAALNVLDDDPDGFFLLVEGGAVDWASHDNQPGRLVEEVAGFAAAVDAVLAWVAAHGGWTQNLVVVTADHETGSLGGPAPATGPEPACPALLPLEPRGRGRMPELRFHRRGHTNALVPLMAAGPGSRRLSAAVVAVDSIRGPWIENVALGALLQDVADHPATR